MDISRFPAYLFDLDGVLTPTAEVHMVAWSAMFNEYLCTVGGQEPYTDQDYFTYVDGKPRYDGVRDFLASRGIHLPEGTPADEPAEETVCGLGNRKNEQFNRIIAEQGITPYPGSLALVQQLHSRGIGMAVVSSSRNAPAVLAAAQLTEYFPVIVDGNTAKAHGLPGKPEPDTFQYAARQLGVPPAQAVVLEDAVSGVAAGAAGDFGMVIGVDRGVGAEELRRAGANLVVADLAELMEGDHA